MNNKSSTLLGVLAGVILLSTFSISNANATQQGQQRATRARILVRTLATRNVNALQVMIKAITIAARTNVRINRMAVKKLAILNIKQFVSYSE